MAQKEQVAPMAVNAYVDSLEGLSPELQKEYKPIEVEKDGKKMTRYQLDVEGAYLSEEDVGPLKRAKDHEKKQRQDVEKKFKDASTQLETLQTEIEEMRKGNIPKGDVEKLEATWKGQKTKLENDYKTELASRDSTLRELLVDNVAQTMASKISTAPAIMMPHIKSRLTVENVDGKFITRVLDKDGKASSASIEELQKQLTEDKAFAPIIVGSKASGGGAGGGGGGGGGASRGNPKFDWNKASPTEKAAQIKAIREKNGA